MKKQTCRGLLALLLLCVMTLTPAMAADTQTRSPAAWAYDSLCDAEALNLLSQQDMDRLWQPVTGEKLDGLVAAVEEQLALLSLPAAPADEEGLVVDSTRGGVLNALYQAVSAYELEGLPAEPVACMQALGVLRGNERGELMLERTCTLQEALVFAQRLVTNVYDRVGAGSQGLLWKAQGNGNTLYLLGTIHVDRGNVYPMHKTLRDALLSSQALFLELDFGDVEGISAFQAMQVYSDGTGLKDHIDGTLYQQVVDALKPLGMTEEQVNQYKPWALANTFSSLSTMDASTGDSPMVVDTYVYSKAVVNGITVSGVETYEFQGGLFDQLSAEYQQEYLAGCLWQYQHPEDSQGMQMIDEMLAAWKARDLEQFEAIYDKEGSIATGDELTVKLFEQRDPNMTAAADELLKTPGEHVFFLAVGAGHMVGDTGIVQSLRELGYTVTLVPAE